MRILIISMANHMYANYLLKELIKNREGEILGVIESNSLIENRPFPVSIYRLVKTGGLFWFISQISKQVIFRIKRDIFRKNRESKLSSYKLPAARYAIPIFRTSDINQKETLRLIKELRPDIIVSLFFNQILGRELIELPVKGCLNLHPALLPKYRGVSPIFWALVNGEEKVGLTIHYIEKKVDSGDILMQKEIPIQAGDTEDSLFWKSALLGNKLLTAVFEEMKKGSPKRRPQNSEEATYFSWPTRQAVKKFRKNGRKFYRLKELWDR